MIRGVFTYRQYFLSLPPSVCLSVSRSLFSPPLSLYIYVYMRGTRGVMVIVVGIGHGQSELRARPRLFSWAVWHSCRMGARNQEQTRGRIGPRLRLGNLRVGELHFCPLCTALDQASSLSRKLAYVPGPTFGFVKLLASSGSHCTK